MADQGLRSAVTGGAQMDGFIDLFMELITDSGIANRHVFRKKAVELPGFFRPTKEWDLLVVCEDMLLVAIEAKSQVGPSFGNNFNNRTEEALGSALDLWTAGRQRKDWNRPTTGSAQPEIIKLLCLMVSKLVGAIRNIICFFLYY
jgi:Restriction endonuclease XhoI